MEVHRVRQGEERKEEAISLLLALATSVLLPHRSCLHLPLGMGEK